MWSLKRYYSQIIETSYCHIWKGRKNEGYGYLRMGKYKIAIRAHVFAFILHHKRIPQGVLHHNCNNKLCVNPLHLEEKTRSEHLTLHRERDFCIHGHEIAIVGRDKYGTCMECRKTRYKRNFELRVGGRRITIAKIKEMNNESAISNIEQTTKELDNRIHECSK